MAILGGGIAGLTTALELTATPELREQYDVTIHQMGWRPGGKCASGRDLERSARIEEHGIHFWYGNYDNGFRLLRDVYTELDRGPDVPIRDLTTAFRPLARGALCDDYDGRWSIIDFPVPTNVSMPGDDATMPTLADIVEMALERIGHGRATAQDRIDALWAEHRGSGGTPGRALEAIAARTVDALDRATNAALRFTARHVHLPGHAHVLPALLGRLRAHSWRRYRPHVADDHVRHAATMTDLTLTLLIGYFHDRMLSRGFGVADDEEFRDWLTRHGADPLTLDSPWVRAQYDQVFGAKGGPSVLDLFEGKVFGRDEHRSEALAAGVAVSVYFRQFLLLRGAVLWKMNAGMGDTVIAPMYETLVRRGVRFEFFRRVDAIRIDDDGHDITSIEITRQAELAGDDPYQPLVHVAGLPCFPSRPSWEQLRRGADLRRDEVDFEAGDVDPGIPERDRSTTLRRGEDFDVAVLAISAAALPAICGDLLDNDDKPALRDCLAHTHTVMTQGLQLWLNTPLDTGLGWTHGPIVVSTFVEPLDTYCDMSHLVATEQWPADLGVETIAYFCGALEDRHHDTLHDARERAQDQARELLDAIAPIWPGSLDDHGFRWELLADPDDGDGPDRLASQFVRANQAPTERYVQTPPGTTKFRLGPDESGYPSLILAGDWTKTGPDMGCVEATVMSGMRAARAISGSPVHIAWESPNWILSS